MGIAADKIAAFAGRLSLFDFVGVVTAISCAAFVALPFMQEQVWRAISASQRCWREIERGNTVSLPAIKGEPWSAVTPLVRDRHSWSQHVGEIPTVVSQDARGQGDGRALSQETFALALGAALEKLSVQMTSTKGARSRCSKASASRPMRCCGITSGASTARPMTSSCLGTGGASRGTVGGFWPAVQQ